MIIERSVTCCVIALTDDIRNRETAVKGIDHSYYCEAGE